MKDVLLGVLCSLYGLFVFPPVATAFALVSLMAQSQWYLIGCIPFLLGLLAVLSIDRDKKEMRILSSVYATPDEPPPGDLLEPDIKRLYDTRGYLVASLSWYLHRNRAMGIAAWFKRKLDDGVYLNGDLAGYQKLDNGAWRNVKVLGIFQFGWGNQTTRNKQDGCLYAMPWFTVKFTRKGKL